MKRYIILPFVAVSVAVHAQNTYMNERLSNNSGDVIGTARYVGMGGALGALGADISVISWNPAGIGLYRKNDIAITFGGHWGTSRIDEENRGKGTFDQAGFVLTKRTNSDACPYVNFAFNYQKKINYSHNFYADNPDLHELSQLDQVAELTDWDEGWQNNLAGMALDNGYFSTARYTDSEGVEHEYRRNEKSSLCNEYTLHSEGALHSFDFNVSTNINNRAFLGLTVGVDNMRYSGWTYYREYYYEDEKARYDLNEDIRVRGTGVNVKLGTIVRPIEDNPFRLAFVMETPTWYRLTSKVDFDLAREPNNLGSRIDPWRSELDFNLRTPWKFRFGMGSTFGSTLAWDIDYEFSAYKGMSMGYPEREYSDGSTSGNIRDKAMNEHTRDNMRPIHTLRFGLEANANKHLSFRLGYNLSSSPYKKDITFDQYSINSSAMDYATSTNYMRLGNTNILTLGMGYHAKSFYIDLAYKIRNQKADFYAFDTSFTNDDGENTPRFVIDNPDLVGRTLDPVDVNLTRQTITCTMGFKF